MLNFWTVFCCLLSIFKNTTIFLGMKFVKSDTWFIQRWRKIYFGHPGSMVNWPPFPHAYPQLKIPPYFLGMKFVNHNVLMRTILHISVTCTLVNEISYRVNHIALWFLIWLKMTLKCIVHMKTRRFYNHNNPPFDMKHQLMSADPLPVIKIDLK